MTDSETTTEVNVKARVRGTDQVEPATGMLWRLLDWIVGFFPTYRDTRDGRKTKKQMQVVLVIVGVVLLVIAGTAETGAAGWILLGVLIACLAFVIPVEELKMRSWRSTFNKKQQPRDKTRWDRGHVDYDGRYLAVYAGDDRVRRINIERAKHDVATRRFETLPALGILPPGAKKDESIWVIATDDVDVDVDLEETIEDDEMERPAKVDASGWEKLWEALAETG